MMVHKKSEYELQFVKLSNDIRAQIWKENLIFREAQKKLNLSDHYWRYQLIDDPCDCDEDRNIVEDSVRSNKTSALCTTENLSIPLEGIAIQTTDVEKIVENNQKTSTVQESSLKQNPSIVNISEETTSLEPSSLPQNTLLKKNSCTSYNTDVLKKKHGLKEIIFDNQDDRTSQILDGVPSRSAVYSRLNRSPTRNALKSYHSEERGLPVFAAFGWNDTEKDVGEQKTYNVRAPVGEVYSSALLASANRLKDLESHLTMAWKKRQKQRSLHQQGPVNLSGIWMTEYQENFSKGLREPLTRNACARPIVWRFT